MSAETLVNPPTVSIVIPCWRQSASLWPSLNACLKQDYPALREIIVVHRDFTSEEKARLADWPVVSQEVRRPGPAAARNLGVRAAHGEYIAFIDSDCVPERPWLKRLIQSLNHPSIVGAGGRVRSAVPRTPTQHYLNRMQDAGVFLNQEYSFYDEFPLPFLTTQNCLYLRRALLAAGLLDETLHSGDDQDLPWRLILEGWQIRYVPDAVVYHEHPRNLRSLLRQHFRAGRAATDLMVKYADFPFHLAGTCHRFSAYAWYLRKVWSGFAHDSRRDKVLTTLRVTATMAGRLYQRLRRLLWEQLPRLPLPAEDYAWVLHRGGKIVLQGLRRSERIELNESASFIWLEHLRGADDRTVAHRVAQEFDVGTDAAEQAVSSLLSTVRRLKVRTPKRSGEPACLIQ